MYIITNINHPESYVEPTMAGGTRALKWIYYKQSPGKLHSQHKAKLLEKEKAIRR